MPWIDVRCKYGGTHRVQVSEEILDYPEIHLPPPSWNEIVRLDMVAQALSTPTLDVPARPICVRREVFMHVDRRAQKHREVVWVCDDERLKPNVDLRGV